MYRKPWMALLAIFLLAACAAPTPFPTLPAQTPPAAETATLAAPPTTSPSPTAASVAPAAYPLPSYGLVMDYDPARWAVQGEELVSQAMPSCRIREQGPTEIPQPIPTPASQTLGPVRYDVYTYAEDEPPVAWYLAREGVAGYDEKAIGIPIVVASAAAGEFEACRAEVEQLLATLRAAP